MDTSADKAASPVPSAKYDALVSAMAFLIAETDPTIQHGRNDESTSDRADFCNEIWHELGDEAEAVMADIFGHPYLTGTDNNKDSPVPDASLPSWMWERATDPDMPPGVFEFRHPDGRRDRFPLIEFMVSDDPNDPR